MLNSTHRRRAVRIGLCLPVLLLLTPGCSKEPEPNAPGYYTGQKKPKNATANSDATGNSAGPADNTK